MNFCRAANAGTGECRGPFTGGLCNKHRSQLYHGIIDKTGKKLRDFKRKHGCGYDLRRDYPQCIAKHAGTGKCTRWERGKRFCIRHESQVATGIIDWNGKKLRDPAPGRHAKWPKGRCVAEKLDACSGTLVAGLCQHHRFLFLKGYITRDGTRWLKKWIPKIRYTGCIAKNSGTGKCSKWVDGKFCGRHNWQFHAGVLDQNGKKRRDFKVRGRGAEFERHSRCLFHDCKKPNNGRFCDFHWGQLKGGLIDWLGNYTRELKRTPPLRGNKRCLAHGDGPCNYWGGGRFCQRHWNHFYKGIIDINGKRLRKLWKELRCGVEIRPGVKCGKPCGHKRRLCKFHYHKIVVQEHYEYYPSLSVAPQEVSMKEFVHTWDGKLVAV